MVKKIDIPEKINIESVEYETERLSDGGIKILLNLTHAELKIFMTASPEVRAKRRYEELSKKGIHINYQEVLHNIRERDQMDSTRKESPLRKAEDAITLDNTSMTKQEQAKISLQWAKGVIAALDK